MKKGMKFTKSYDDIVYNLGYELLQKQMSGESLTEVETTFLSHVVNDVDRQIKEYMNTYNKKNNL